MKRCALCQKELDCHGNAIYCQAEMNENPKKTCSYKAKLIKVKEYALKKKLLVEKISNLEGYLNGLLKDKDNGMFDPEVITLDLQDSDLFKIYEINDEKIYAFKTFSIYYDDEYEYLEITRNEHENSFKII